MHSLKINPENSVKDLVLTKAIIKMAQFYELTGKDLSELIGISEASTTRFKSRKKTYFTRYKRRGDGAFC